MGGGLVLLRHRRRHQRRPLRRLQRRAAAAERRHGLQEAHRAAREARCRPNPQDEAALGGADQAALSATPSTGENFDQTQGAYTAKGKREARQASGVLGALPGAEPDEARRQRRDPDGPGLRPAGLNQLDKAVDAHGDRASTSRKETREPLRPARVLAYAAGQNRKGDLAEQTRRSSLTPKDRAQASSRPQIDQQKSQHRRQQHGRRQPQSGCTRRTAPLPFAAAPL